MEMRSHTESEARSHTEPGHTAPGHTVADHPAPGAGSHTAANHAGPGHTVADHPEPGHAGPGAGPHTAADHPASGAGSPIERCPWAGELPIYQAYHDEEWGRPLHDEVRLFEMLILEGMQAGLSWITVLKKREDFREAFEGFRPEKVARYGPEKLEALMQNPKIIRNRLKLQSAVTNARAFLAVQERHGSFDRFLWSYVADRPIVNHFPDISCVPATTPLSDRLSRDLKKLGFKFVGSTIVYAYMQAVGLVNDHLSTCYLGGQCA